MTIITYHIKQKKKSYIMKMVTNNIITITSWAKKKKINKKNLRLEIYY